MSPNFMLGYACVVNAMYPFTTATRPWTIVCNSTVQDAQVRHMLLLHEGNQSVFITCRSVIYSCMRAYGAALWPA